MTVFPEKQPFHFEVEEIQNAGGRTLRFHCAGKTSWSDEMISFQKEVEARIAEGVNVVLDMGGITELSNTLLSTVVRFRYLTYRQGSRLDLENVPPPIEKGLHMVGYYTMFRDQKPAGDQKSGSADSSPGSGTS